MSSTKIVLKPAHGVPEVWSTRSPRSCRLSDFGFRDVQGLPSQEFNGAVAGSTAVRMILNPWSPTSETPYTSRTRRAARQNEDRSIEGAGFRGGPGSRVSK